MLLRDGLDFFYESCLCLSRQDLYTLSWSAMVLKGFVDTALAPSSGLCRYVLPRVVIRPAGVTFAVGPNGVRVEFAGDVQQQLHDVFQAAQYTYVRSFEVADPQGIILDPENFGRFNKLTATLSVEHFKLTDTDVSRLFRRCLHSMLLSFESLGTIHCSTSLFAPAQLSDDFLAASAQRGACVALNRPTREEEEPFPITDDGILDFCFSKEYAFRRRELTLVNVDVSEEFLRRLAERLNDVAHLECVRISIWEMPRRQRRLEQDWPVQRREYILHVNEGTTGTHFARIKYAEPLVTTLRPFFSLLLTTDKQEYLASAPSL